MARGVDVGSWLDILPETEAWKALWQWCTSAGVGCAEGLFSNGG